MDDNYENPEFIQVWKQFLEDLDSVVEEANKYADMSEPPEDDVEQRDLYQIFTGVKRDLMESDSLNLLDNRMNGVHQNVPGYLMWEMRKFGDRVADFTDWLPDDPRDKFQDIIDRLKDLLNMAQTIKDSIKDAAGNLSGLLDILNEVIDFFKDMGDDGLNSNSIISEFST